MTRLVPLFAITSSVSAASALADDVLKPQAAMPVAAVFSRTGCYVGLNAGALRSVANFEEANALGREQARFAAQAGCNHQINSIVVGGEA